MHPVECWPSASLAIDSMAQRAVPFEQSFPRSRIPRCGFFFGRRLPCPNCCKQSTAKHSAQNEEREHFSLHSCHHGTIPKKSCSVFWQPTAGSVRCQFNLIT